MCEFSKQRHMAQNQEEYLKAANEGRHPNSVFAEMIMKRLVCTAGVVFLVILVIGLSFG